MLVPAPRSTDPPAGSRDFTHELVRQVAYDAVLGQDRIALHSRILATLEEMPDGEPRHDLAGALAHHALIAQEWAKAAQYAAAIARQSFAQSALPDATRHYESAMQALDRLPASTDREAKAIDLRIEARLAYANVGNVSRWLDLAKEAEARSAAIGDDVRKAAALAVRAAALNFCGAPKDALETGAQAVAQATRCRNPGWLAYAEYGLGQACYIAGRYQEGVEHFKQAHQRFAIGGAKPPVGGSGIQAGLLCCMMACLCHIALGEEAAAADVQRTANETAAQEGRPLAAIAAAYSQGALLLHQDRTVEAEAALSQALTLAKRHEVNLFVPVIACQLGLTLLLLGRAPEARQTLDLARAEADALGHRSASVRADIYRVLSDAVLADGRATQLQALQAVTRTARQQGYDPLELEALLLAAALHRLAGEETLGAGCAATAEDVAARSGAEGTLRDFREYLRRLLGSAGS
jgi:tetratricopeptide (TPR) repeat protein